MLIDLEKILYENLAFKDAETVFITLKEYNLVELIEKDVVVQALRAIGDRPPVLKSKEDILEEIDKKQNDYLCSVYNKLTAREYFEDYEGFTEEAEKDIRKAYKDEFSKGILKESDIEDLVEEHMCNVDHIARNKRDWGV